MRYLQLKKSSAIDKIIIDAIIREKTNEEIVEETGYSLSYIKKRLHFLYGVYNVRTKVGLVREVLREL